MFENKELTRVIKKKSSLLAFSDRGYKNFKDVVKIFRGGKFKSALLSVQHGN